MLMVGGMNPADPFASRLMTLGKKTLETCRDQR